MRRIALVALLVSLSVPGALACTRDAADPSSRKVTAADKDLDDDLVGTTPPAWKTTEWIAPPDGADGTPGAGTTLAQLRGRVVLIRWFMGTSCPFCTATMPSLKKLHADYASRGLVVIGLYHHKEEGPLRPGQYAAYVKSFGITFPTARDPDWKTLETWWLTKERDFTSVSFLLDRAGRVRGVHAGGKYAPPAFEAIQRGVERLLAEPSPTPGT